MVERKWDKLIYVFLILQPFIDLATSLTVRFTNVSLTIGIISRGLFIAIMVVYFLFFCKSSTKKKSVLYLSILLAYYVAYILSKSDGFSIYFFKQELTYAFKYFYFPLLSVCLLNCYEQLGFRKEQLFKLFILNAIVYATLIFIPEVTGTSFATYAQASKKGSTGWFFAANEIGAVLILLFPYLYYLLYKRYSIFKTVLIFIFTLWSISFIGTKATLLGVLITIVFYLLYFLINRHKNRGFCLIVSVIITVITFASLPFITTSRNVQNQLSNPNEELSHQSQLENKSEIVIDTKQESISQKNKYSKWEDPNIKRILAILFSGRERYLGYMLDIYEEASLTDKLLGVGFEDRPKINDANIGKLIESDTFDIFFRYGIVGFTLYFLPLGYIVFINLRKMIRNSSVVPFHTITNLFVIGLLCAISMFAGHVFGAPSVSIYLAFALAMLYNEDKEIRTEHSKKKISILALHLGFGGTEKYLSSLCKMLENEYELEIISTYKLSNEPAFYFSNQINIQYLINGGPNNEAFRTAVQERKMFRVIKEGFKALWILYLKRSRNIAAIRNIDADYIITTRPFHSRWAGYYADDSIIKIATEHNFHNNDKKYVRKVINSIKNFSYFVVVSKKLLEYYKMKTGTVQCVYIPNVIDELPQNKSRLTTNNIISIGRLSEEKGQRALIDVVDYVQKVIPNVKLYIVGDGPTRNELETLVQKRKLNDSIIFTGFLKKDEMEHYILDSSVFVLPSYTESFGLVIIEAMSYGLPCIAFDCADGAKNLLNNHIGILVENRDAKKMAESIIELLNDNAKKNQYACVGMLECQKYLLPNVKQEWLDLLNR